MYYENDAISARLAYSYRTKYKLGNRGGADYFQSANGSLNASFNYTLNKNGAVHPGSAEPAGPAANRVQG